MPIPPRAHLVALLVGICLLPGCHRSSIHDLSQQQLPASRVSQTSVGASVRGQPIELIRFGNSSPVVLVIAGIHGDEISGCYVAEQLIAHLRTSPPGDGTGAVAIIARANPDGCVKRNRTNAHGVDLNRNFPAANWKPTRPGLYYAGQASGSEPETAALVGVIESLKPRLIITIHSIQRGQECNNYDGPARDLAEAMSRLNHYPVRPAMGYATPGSLGSWAGIDRHIPIITLELPRHLSGDDAWLANRAALLMAVRSQRG
jgi:murein peptide amidase A